MRIRGFFFELTIVLTVLVGAGMYVSAKDVPLIGWVLEGIMSDTFLSNLELGLALVGLIILVVGLILMGGLVQYGVGLLLAAYTISTLRQIFMASGMINPPFWEVIKEQLWGTIPIPYPLSPAIKFGELFKKMIIDLINWAGGANIGAWKQPDQFFQAFFPTMYLLTGDPVLLFAMLLFVPPEVQYEATILLAAAAVYGLSLFFFFREKFSGIFDYLLYLQLFLSFAKIGFRMTLHLIPIEVYTTPGLGRSFPIPTLPGPFEAVLSAFGGILTDPFTLLITFILRGILTGDWSKSGLVFKLFSLHALANLGWDIWNWAGFLLTFVVLPVMADRLLGTSDISILQTGIFSGFYGFLATVPYKMIMVTPPGSGAIVEALRAEEKVILKRIGEYDRKIKRYREALREGRIKPKYVDLVRRKIRGWELQKRQELTRLAYVRRKLEIAERMATPLGERVMAKLPSPGEKLREVIPGFSPRQTFLRFERKWEEVAPEVQSELGWKKLAPITGREREAMERALAGYTPTELARYWGTQTIEEEYEKFLAEKARRSKKSSRGIRDRLSSIFDRLRGR